MARGPGLDFMNMNNSTQSTMSPSSMKENPGSEKKINEDRIGDIMYPKIIETLLHFFKTSTQSPQKTDCLRVLGL
jgi:hypothetical protein